MHVVHVVVMMHVVVMIERMKRIRLKINSLLKNKNKKEMHLFGMFYKHLTSIYSNCSFITYTAVILYVLILREKMLHLRGFSYFISYGRYLIEI